MKFWNKQEEEQLSVYINDSFSYKEIALKLNRTVSSIQHKCKRLNLHCKNKQIIRRTHEQYVLELTKKCPTIIAIENYINASTPILHKCLTCNTIYKCEPSKKLQGYGHCKAKFNRGGGIDKNKPGILYLVYISAHNLYKIGITSKTIKARFRDNNLPEDKYEIILERHFDMGIECETLEKEWLSNICEYKVNTGLLHTGNTETFRY